MELCNSTFNCLINTSFEIHWIHSSCNRLHSFTNDCLSKNCCSSSSISSTIRSFRCDFFNHLSTHIFKFFFQFNFFCNRNPIFSNCWSSKRSFKYDIFTFWTHCYFHCISKCIHTFNHFLANIITKSYVFSCHVINSPYTL